MKQEYKVTIFSVLVGFLFIFSEALSRFMSSEGREKSLSQFIKFMFEPLSPDQVIFYPSLLLFTLVFGLIIARLLTRYIMVKDAATQNDIEKNMILDFVPEIVIYVNNNFKMKWASRSLYTETGMTENDLINEPLENIALSLFEKPLVEEHFNKLKDEKGMDIVVLDLKEQYWQIRSNTMRNEKGKESGFVLLAVNITKNKRDEEIMRASYNQLKENIEQFATVIDNIRNPLSVILLSAETSNELEVSKKIIDQCDEIEDVISRLDEGWSNSEEIRNFLKKHL